jgi:murein DD-endopeptidase MepM/ murein hydrolase activator NlpD
MAAITKHRTEPQQIHTPAAVTTAAGNKTVPANNSIKSEPLSSPAKPDVQTRSEITPPIIKQSRPSTAFEEIHQTLNPQAQAESTISREPTTQNPSQTFAQHKVEPKETIYRISKTYNVSVLDIMAANDFEKPQDLKSGTLVRIPVTAQPVVAAVKSAEPSPVSATVAVADDAAIAATEPAAGNPPLSTQMTEQANPQPVQIASREMPAGINLQNTRVLSDTEAEQAESRRGKIDTTANRASGLVWPVKGQVIRRFGQDGSGIAHTGINIAVPTGTPVLASEGGKVLYADDGLKIYGKLVLLRHDNGMVSAYAHNGYLLVKKGENVKKGQIIAMSGATGNVDTPQLHFELRQHASAIDPMRMLPKL